MNGRLQNGWGQCRERFNAIGLDPSKLKINVMISYRLLAELCDHFGIVLRMRRVNQSRCHNDRKACRAKVDHGSSIF
jgi:hypothetical protein